jgi:hypothetical protein
VTREGKARGKREEGFTGHKAQAAHLWKRGDKFRTFLNKRGEQLLDTKGLCQDGCWLSKDKSGRDGTGGECPGSYHCYAVS